MEDDTIGLPEPPPAYREYHFAGTHIAGSRLGDGEPGYEMISGPLRSPLRSPFRSPQRSPLRSPRSPRYMGSDGMSTVDRSSNRESRDSDFW